MAYDVKRALLVHWPIKLTALALATVLWAAVTAEEPTTQLVPVTLNIQAPDGRTVNQELPVVQALYRGPPRELIKLYASPPVIRKVIGGTSSSSVDLDLRPEDLSLTIDASVTAQDVEPRRIVVALDSLAHTTVPVEARVVVQPDSGFEMVGSVIVTPESVVVSGPEAQVRSIQSVWTIPFEFEGLRLSTSRSVPIDTTTLRMVRLTPSDVTVSATIAEITTRVLANVPVRVVARQNGQWTPETRSVLVTVRGAAARIGRLTRDSLTVTATPSGNNEVETVRLSIQAPSGVTARATPDAVVVRRR